MPYLLVKLYYFFFTFDNMLYFPIFAKSNQTIILTLNIMKRSFSLKARLKSFTYAFNGLRVMLKNEHNFRIHCFATVCAVTTGIIFNLSALEWAAIVFAIVLVVAGETFNSAVERLCDFVQPGRDERIGIIKDMSAGAVLLCAIAAVIIGLLVFVPKFTCALSGI